MEADMREVQRLTSAGLVLSELQAEFATQGYLVLRNFAAPAQIAALRQQALAELEAARPPLEYEADLGYPGAPVSRQAPGGVTPRRLLGAYARHRLFQAQARLPALLPVLQQLLGPTLALTQSHHNCIMTKHPGFSSATHWHQDNRYWRFTRPDLVTAWWPLGEETPTNGGMQLIPGSHCLHLPQDNYDAQLFLRPEHPDNQSLLARALGLQLQPGDLLLFHSRLLHAAGRNQTPHLKLSLVFSYHAQDNLPLAGSRSAALPSVPV